MMKNKRLVSHLKRTGYYVWKYKAIYITLLLLITVFELFMIINFLINKKFTTTRNIIYFCSYVILFISSISAFVFIMAFRKNKNAMVMFSIGMHIYSIFIVAWSTLISCADVMSGAYPIVYLTVLISIAGLIAINPIVTISLIVISLPFIIGFAVEYKELNSFVSVGGMFNIFVFIIMVSIVGYRMYYVTLKESKHKEEMQKAMNTDPITGLNNERKYLNIIDNIDYEYNSYAVVMMDLNALKHTNDTYGHRYGCHLVRETGRILPTIFKESILFHIGGDEFIAIVIKNDLLNLDNIMNEFNDKLSETYVNYEDVKLLLSVAGGVAIKENGEKYKDVYMRADKNMYDNKAMLKSKLNIIDR